MFKNELKIIKQIEKELLKDINIDEHWQDLPEHAHRITSYTDVRKIATYIARHYIRKGNYENVGKIKENEKV